MRCKTLAIAALVCIIGSAALLSQTKKPPMSANPLISAWAGPYGGVPPWDQMTPAYFPAAFEAALAEQRKEIDAIVDSPAAPTFDNTIAAMERAGLTLDRIERMFSVARENVTTPEYQALEREWQPKLAAAADAIFFNPGLFKRIEAVYQSLQAIPAPKLEPDQIRLATRVYEHFVRRGAKLNLVDKKRLSEINQDLAARFADFRAKVLADENTWTVLQGPAELTGLPASLIATAKAAADERGLSGKWAIVNTRSSVDPFLTFSTRRDLREVVWRKFKSRGDNGDANDTKATVTAVVKLRAERAKLLGYPSHAHWRMSDTMAADPAVAQAFMRKVWPGAVARVREEVAEMQSIADREQPGSPIEPWDYLYFAEKVRKANYDLDQAELKPYFELNNMVAAALWAAERRFGITFKEITGTVPVFHPDVRVWEVVDKGAGRHRALFYLDNFARAGKRSGAWASSYRSQNSFVGATSLTSNNNNFVKGAPGEPVLISLDDARTLFHEFGHALHSMLQNVRYRSLAATPRDYVEFPSQLNERWLLTREVLDRYARHFKTGEPLPQKLVDRIDQSGKFNQGYATVEYLAAAIVDMDLHLRSEGVEDIAAFEREALARIGGMPREIVLRHRLAHFDHLFGSDSYSAGYYSYLWSDVMAADAWQTFVEAGGPWDVAANDRLRTHILSDGNSIDRAEAYHRFRGRDPDVRALFEARGFPTP
jgi:peptidyl-dipeptidase Dcp